MKRVCFAILAMIGCLEAKEFGQRGPLFPIEEENLEEHFRKMGAQAGAQVLEGIRQEIEQPEPLGLPRAETETSHLVDLFGLNLNMLFFDGSDPAQVAWAKEQEDSFLWILTGGSPSELEEETGREIFFDQMGLYTSRLKVTAVPATAVPEEGQIRVTQVLVKP